MFDKDSSSASLMNSLEMLSGRISMSVNIKGGVAYKENCKIVTAFTFD